MMFELGRRYDEAVPPYLKLDELAVHYGIDAADAIADKNGPLVLIIGTTGYVSREDVRRYLAWRETHAMDRRYRGVVLADEPRNIYRAERDQLECPEFEVPTSWRVSMDAALDVAVARSEAALAAPEPEPLAA